MTWASLNCNGIVPCENDIVANLEIISEKNYLEHDLSSVVDMKSIDDDADDEDDDDDVVVVVVDDDDDDETDDDDDDDDDIDDIDDDDDLDLGITSGGVPRNDA